MLAALLLTVAGLSHAKTGGGKPKALAAVEAQYKGARLQKADQDRYKALHDPIVARKPGEGSLSDCHAKTGKIEELRQALAGMVAAASAPKPVKVGDRWKLSKWTLFYEILSS